MIITAFISFAVFILSEYSEQYKKKWEALNAGGTPKKSVMSARRAARSVGARHDGQQRARLFCKKRRLPAEILRLEAAARVMDCPALSLPHSLHHRRAERAGKLGFFWGYHAAACFLLYESREQAVLRAAAGEADVAVVGDAGE